MTNPCPHIPLVDITSPVDNVNSVLCNDCGAVITTPRGLPKDAPMVTVELDGLKLELDVAAGHIRIMERRPYSWTSRYNITPDQAEQLASALLTVANETRSTSTTVQTYTRASINGRSTP